MKTDMHSGAPPFVFIYAKLLRKNPTPAEKVLWSYLRKNQMKRKFRRQHPIWLYVGDFYCHSLRLVIEVDGGIHEDQDQRKKDLEKEKAFLNFGLHIIRFTNSEVTCSIDDVLSRLSSKIVEIKHLPVRTKLCS